MTSWELLLNVTGVMVPVWWLSTYGFRHSGLKTAVCAAVMCCLLVSSLSLAEHFLRPVVVVNVE